MMVARSLAGFGMFQAMGRETEHTSQWESGVGHSKTSARSSREHAEAEIIFPSLFPARKAVPAARFWVLEGAMPSEPRSRRPDSGRQPRGHSTFGPPEPRTQPRAAGQPHRLERKTTFQPSDTFHCNLVRRLVGRSPPRPKKIPRLLRLPCPLPGASTPPWPGVSCSMPTSSLFAENIFNSCKTPVCNPRRLWWLWSTQFYLLLSDFVFMV